MLAVGIGVLLALTVSVEPVKKEVALGEPVELRVTLTHDSVKAEALAGPELVLDQGSLTLTIGEGADQFVYRRKLDKPPAAVELTGGASATVSWTPVRAGVYPIEAVYMGKASDETQVTVKPAPGGETELGILMKTSKGEMTMRFFPEVAPNHVAHFAERVRTGFYDGLEFHRIIEGFMAQGGDPQGTGSGGPGYTIPAEFTKDKKYSHTFGRLSTARTPDPNSAGSQFFICFDGATQLDGQYTVFGEVFEGRETVRSLEKASVPGGVIHDRSKRPTIEKATLVPIKAKG